MCGILLYSNALVCFEDEQINFEEGSSIPTDICKYSQIFNSISSLIANRGPNFSSLRSSKDHHTSWFSSVLSLRQPFTKQSINVQDKFILQFNGELYNQNIVENDSQYIVNLLGSLKNDNKNSIIEVIRALDGEFSYTIYDLQERRIYFGRDPIGKRSLSYKIDKSSNEIFIASVTGEFEGIQDCVGGIIYIYDIQSQSLDDSNMINEYPYKVSDDLDPDSLKLNNTIEELYNHLSDAVQRRINTIHPAHIENSPIAVLFSGGLDCSVIVAFICEQLKHLTDSSQIIELLNVGFENPRTSMSPKDAPDRKLAVSSAIFLQNLYPEVDIRLIEIDVSYKEYLEIRPNVIKLMYPKNTEMDLSIAIAFYFASRGEGYLMREARLPYQRKGIVLFSGLGADELYGGYHKFANKSTEDLVKELNIQINNIYDRNLNRDDKVIADNGVEVRYPFLDDKVIEYSTSKIPINYKINKLILRKLASQKLNLGEISDEPKRAIQFGSKSAKMTKDGNKNGTDVLK